MGRVLRFLPVVLLLWTGRELRAAEEIVRIQTLVQIDNVVHLLPTVDAKSGESIKPRSEPWQYEVKPTVLANDRIQMLIRLQRTAPGKAPEQLHETIVTATDGQLTIVKVGKLQLVVTPTMVK
ncbi:unnamed protein product [Tuwongella immobilis]|uniref:Uncharacterized protein n=2 Tax=Tuwongella immobilis TaxID=692036 RepID=A0A6C2YVM1_9BACT|nr:unnamed protein product [Tuwongella immobilis]VTS07268.1 unnamed protein product [Tuwongella immobilis]